MELPKIIDPTSGEILPPPLVKAKTVEKYLQTLNTNQISKFLTEVNWFKKIADVMEKATKNYIKTTTEFEFDDDGKAFYGEWKVSQVTTTKFDKKRLEAEGTPMEIEFYQNLERKYSTTTTAIKIG